MRQLAILLFVFLVYAIIQVDAFRRGRPAEVGLCTTLTKDKGYETKFSCLEGKDNYCCGSRTNQTCCNLEEFAANFRSLLNATVVFISVIAVLIVLLIGLSAFSIFLTCSVDKSFEAEEIRTEAKQAMKELRKKEQDKPSNDTNNNPNNV